MYLSPYFAYAGATVVAGIISRVWVRFKRDRSARKAMKTTLFPAELLSNLFSPMDSDNDDISILTEMKQTLSHLNKQAFAEEFWNLDKDLTRYYKRVPKHSRTTMERALVRLIESDEKWLQIVGAKTCASLKLNFALDSLKSAVIRHQDDDRFKTELESCVERLRVL